MLRYRNEAAFSNALVKAMRAKGWFIQRIESGQTGKGIPDIFTISPNRVAMWLELKREHTTVRGKSAVEIHWRPGQQAWLTDVNHRGMLTFTIACFDDSILQIPHTRIYEQNLVPAGYLGLFCYNSIKELIT